MRCRCRAAPGRHAGRGFQPAMCQGFAVLCALDRRIVDEGPRAAIGQLNAAQDQFVLGGNIVCHQKRARPGDAAPHRTAAMTCPCSAPLRTSPASPRPPSASAKASSRIDLPAPVSPVSTEEAGRQKSISSRSIRTISRIESQVSIEGCRRTGTKRCTGRHLGCESGRSSGEGCCRRCAESSWTIHWDQPAAEILERPGKPVALLLLWLRRRYLSQDYRRPGTTGCSGSYDRARPAAVCACSTIPSAM